MTAEARLFDRLEVIDDPQGQAAAYNMAADEALLEHLDDAPILRIYRWLRPAVSFGYFDHVAPVSASYPMRELVRRWTGGGIVEHGKDFTYSLVVPRTHGLTCLRAEESYRLLHGVLATALAAADPEKSAPTGHEGTAVTGQVARACFVNPVRHDLMLGGHKVAGAAQRRTRRGWLHQGSIQLPGETAAVYERLRSALPFALGADVSSRTIRPEEANAANRLTRTKYGMDAWLRRF